MSLSNAEIAASLETVADLLEFDGANAFRVRAYRSAARSIREHGRPLADLVAEGGRLTSLAGVGKGAAEKCEELLESGRLELLDELQQRIPQSVLLLLRIPGLGPKRAATLFRELQVRTLDDLRAACDDGRVAGLKGFGKKTEELILAGLDLASHAETRVLWRDADELAGLLRRHLRECDQIERLEIAGSYRRGKETVGDLDVLIVASDSTPPMDQLQAWEQVETVLVRGSTKMSVRSRNGVQVDMRVVAPRAFGAALQYFTGSKEHNVRLRGLAKDRGLKVNEYGVYRVEKDGDETYICGATEEQVYAALDLPWIPPELREGRREFEWADGPRPELVTLADLVGDLHMHTTDTDGRGSLDEMAAAAAARGLRYIAITDHSKRVAMAGGLDAARLREQWRRIDALNDTLGGRPLVLKGIECDILENGEMDLPDDVLGEADWVLGSIHYGQNQSRAELTARIVGALDHPHVSAIAHPTGRRLNRRKAYPLDMERVIRTAADRGKCLELNANPARLDLNDVHCGEAARQGVSIVISSDAHSVAALDVLRFGVLQARRAGLTPSDVANTRDWPWK